MGLRKCWEENVVTPLKGWWVKKARPWLQQWEYGVLLGVVGFVAGVGVATAP